MGRSTEAETASPIKETTQFYMDEQGCEERYSRRARGV
jgi:hypothetical protein